MGQVDSSGDVRVMSGVGNKGTSYMTLSGGRGLGPEGAQRLADLLQQAPAHMLATLDLRCLAYPDRLKNWLILLPHSDRLEKRTCTFAQTFYSNLLSFFDELK